MLLKLIAMIVLGFLSAALSLYKKNYYVRVIDDILGKEEDENSGIRIGRGFIYGFLFPIFFFLALVGLIALAIFLVIAGVIAAIIFVLVWITEKIIPSERLGLIVGSLFDKIGLSAPAPIAEATPGSDSVGNSSDALPPPAPVAPTPGTSPDTPTDKPDETSEKSGYEPSPDAGINVTRKHGLD
jgi:hypothetical protein